MSKNVFYPLKSVERLGQIRQEVTKRRVFQRLCCNSEYAEIEITSH